MTITHEVLLQIVKRLPQDYEPYGRQERSIEVGDTEYYGYDCAGGCYYYAKLEGEPGSDWGVCTNPKSHRCGLLTFEHQGCFHQVNTPDEISYVEGNPEIAPYLDFQSRIKTKYNPQ